MTEETNTAIARAFETVTAALTRETRESFADVLARVSAALPDEAARAALRERLIAFAAEDTPAARKLARALVGSRASKAAVLPSQKKAAFAAAFAALREGLAREAVEAAGASAAKGVNEVTKDDIEAAKVALDRAITMLRAVAGTTLGPVVDSFAVQFQSALYDLYVEGEAAPKPKAAPKG